MGDSPPLAAEHRRVALLLTPGERRTALILAAVAVAAALALTSPWDGSGLQSALLLIGGATILAVGALRRTRFVTALGGAAVALNPGWGLLFILATPYIALAIVLAVRARASFDQPTP